jgi:TatD DNase family protein
MLDSHCHLDRYKDPLAIARQASQQGVFVIAVTNLPSHFATGLPHVRAMSRVRLALGLHPLAAKDHTKEREQFTDLLPQTSFVGEVGLDFSREGRGTEDIQLESFSLVARSLASTPKFATLHSRSAERETLAVLKQHNVLAVVFHWYSGPLSILDDALAAGHYFSVNPAMITTANGQKIISRVPRNRVLTETDGPFTKCRGRASTPDAVQHVEAHLGSLWNESPSDVRRTIWINFRSLLSQLGLMRSPEISFDNAHLRDRT